MNFTPEERLAR